MPRLDVTQCEGNYLRVRVPLMVVNGGGADENNLVSYIKEQGKSELEQGVARRNIGITDEMYETIKNGGTEGKKYVCTFDNAAGRNSVTIPANAHNCGNELMVQCKVGGSLASIDTSVSAEGDVVVRWGSESLINPNNLLVVSIIGMNVSNIPFGN